MAQFGIENPLFLDSNEAESRVRRGVATSDFDQDPNINVGAPTMPRGLRGPRQPKLEVSPGYEIVTDQTNTERPAPTPGTKLGKFEISSAVNLTFDPVEAPKEPEAPKEERGFLGNLGESVVTGAKGAKVTWSFLADKLAGALGADQSETSRILAEDVKAYKNAWRDPQLQEISKKVDAAEDFSSGAFEMLKGLAQNPSALPYFLAEQTPTMLTGGVAGKVGQSFTTAALSRAGVKAVEKKAIQTATAGAAINAGATTFGSLGANYTEGLQKFGGDTERASDYAATKTLAELPTNVVAGALIGWTPFPSRLANIGTQATIQGAGGASGAYVAAKAVGEEASRSELLLEFIGEFASAPAEALSLGAGKKETSPSGGDGRGTDSSGSLGTGGVTPPAGSPASSGADSGVPDALKLDEQVEGFRRLSDTQIREATSSENGVAFAAALFRNATPEDQKFIRQTVERTGNVSAFDEALNDEQKVEKGQALISQFPDFAELYLQSAKVFASSKPTTSRIKAMPVVQQQGDTNESTTDASTPPGQPGGSVGGNEVLGQTGSVPATETVSQSQGSTGTVDTSKLRFSRTAAPDTRAQDVSKRLQKLFLDQDVPVTTRIEAENALSQGRLDKVEKFIDLFYEKLNKAPKADINGAKRQREFLSKVAERFNLNADFAEVDTLLANNPTKSNVDRVNELLMEQAKKQVQALIKAKKPKSANEVFKRTGLLAENIFAKGEVGSDNVATVFDAAAQDVEQESDIEAPAPKVMRRKEYKPPAPFKFATKYIVDSDFQRLTDLIVAAMGRGEAGAFDAPKVALSKSKEASEFLASLPEAKQEQILGKLKEDGSTTKGWLGNTSVADLRSVLQEQRDEGRTFERPDDKLTPEEREVALKRRSFEAEIYRILNMVNEAATYRDAIARLRAEQDAIYAALNGTRNLFFKNERGQIQIYESAAPEPQAGFIISQFESPKNADADEVVKDLNGLTTAGPMQSVAPERMVDMKDISERSQEALRARAAAITQEIRGLQEKSTREQAKLFRQGLLEVKTRLHNARTMAVRGGLPLSETLEPYENALKSIAALESEKPTVEAQQAMEASEPAEPGFVRDLAAEAREGALKRSWQVAIAEMRNGNMTLGELVNRIRAEGVSVPQEFLSLASELAMRTPLARWLRQNNTGWTYRSQWAASLFHAARKAKEFGLSDDLVADLNLTDGEKFTYFGWLKDRNTVASRRVVDGATTVEEAFGNFLFAKYSLDQMRNPETITNERDRAVLESVFTTPDAMVEAWFEDVYAAHKFDAPMARAAMAADRIDVAGFANVAKEPMISPADAREFKEWRQRKLQNKIVRARVLAESAYSKALANIQGLTDEQYEAIKDQLAIASLNEKDAILRNALELAKKNQQGSPLDAVLADFVDQVMVDDMSYARTPDEIADAMRRASIQNVAEEGVRTRKDFIGEELSGEGESDVVINDDGEFDYEADDQRLAKGKQSGVLTAAIVQAKVKQILSTWKLAPNVEVYQNANALPEPLRSAVIEKLGPDWNAKGLYNGEDGTVYLFSDFLLSEGDVEFTLFHETYGHLGLRAFLGSKFDTFLNTAYRTNQRVKALADQKMAEEGLPRLEAIDEALADIAGEDTPVAGFKALVGRLIAALRESGFERVADWLSKMTDAEVAWTLKMAKETARSGGHKLIEGSPGELRLADERMPYELFSQKDGNTRAYARYNPLTMEWIVFTATGEDIRTDYTSRSMQDYKQVFDLMGQYGKVERRLRSGLYIDDKLPTDLVKVPDFRNVGVVKGLWRTLTQKLQNEYLPVWQYVEHLAKQGKIDDRIDVKKALTLYERRTGALIEDFNNEYVTPMMDLLEQAKKLGATNEDLNNWLIARHAEERNRQVRKINPKNLYGSGMPPNTTRMPDGRVQEGYNQILSRVKNADYSSLFEQIGKLTDTMGVEKVKYEVATGMIGTKDGLARLFAYKKYVNLSGVNSELDETPDLTEMVGTKFNVKGKDKRAMGRVDLAPDVLARTIQAYESALIRGQKNKVAQTVLALMETNYDPDFVVINEQSYRRQVNKDTGLIDYVLDANYIQRDDVMVAKVNGIPTTIRFKQTGAGTFAEAVHGMVYPRQAGPIMEAVGRYTQFIGQLVTTYNPAWIFVNFVRDVQTLFFNAAADKKITKQMAAQMMKEIPGAVRLAMWVASEKSPKLQKMIGQPRPDLLAAYQEMRKEGGLTSFINRKGLDEQVHNIEIALTGNKTPIDRAKALLSFMELLTLPMEMAPRLAAYHVTRKNGFSKSDAAVFSGDITVNFNMRGQSKEIRSLYLFFNPAIQGTNKMYRLAKEDPKTFAKITGAWIAFGAAMGMLGRALNDEDEDGISEYDKVPTYKRATSIVLKTDVPGGSIPIPYGWNAFYALGNFMMDSMMGVQPISTSAKRAAKAAFESFSPMGGAGLDSKTGLGMAFKGVTPTVALPLVEYLMNENRFGSPIYKDDSMFGAGAKTPDAYMAFDSVSPISKFLAQGLNSLTGGSRLREGAIDVNPASIDFAINAYLPGLVSETYKTASVAVKAARGEDTKPLPTPIIGRFEARVPEGYDAGAFRRAKELVDTKYKEYTETRDPKVREEIRKEYPGLGAAKAVLSSTQQEIRRLRQDLSEIENLSNASDSRKVEVRNKIKALEKKLYSRAVKAVMNVGTEENKPFRDVLLANE